MRMLTTKGNTEEPAIDGLFYMIFCLLVGWAQQGLNLRPPACKAGALPLSYTPASERLLRLWPQFVNMQTLRTQRDRVSLRR